MYIEKLPDGRARCHIRVDNKRKSKICDSEADAKRWGKRAETSLTVEPDLSDFTFGDAIHRYRDEISVNKDGAKWETPRLDKFLDYFGNVRLDTIQQPQIAAWRDFRAKTVSGSTVVREKKLLHDVFAFALKEWHWIKSNPFFGVKMPKENDARTSLWDWKRIRRVLRFLNYHQGRKPETHYQQVALAFMIGLHTSLRLSEILRVNSETLNERTRVISVKTKTAKMAFIPISHRALKACRLADFTVTAQQLDAIFRKARDGTMVGDYTFHDSRAFALTMWARKVDILTLSKISQHKDLKMLQRYYRESPEQIAMRI